MKKQNTVLAVVIVAVAAIVVLTASSFSSPQAKGYEYATITQSGATWLSVSRTGVDFSEEKLNSPKSERGILNTKPLLTKIAEFEKEGWELVGITHMTYSAVGGIPYIHLADLRRPIP